MPSRALLVSAPEDGDGLAIETYVHGSGELVLPSDLSKADIFLPNERSRGFLFEVTSGKRTSRWEEEDAKKIIFGLDSE
jgi:hypothetical protein